MAEYYDYVTGRGVIVPDTSSVLSDVQNEFKAVFGNDLDVSPETVQGRLIEMISRSRLFTIQACAAVSNMLNLNTANGFVLDDLGSLFLLSRQPATYTTVNVELGGVSGTIVPEGTRLKSLGGEIFVNTEDYKIGSPLGAVFRAEKTGIIPCPANTLTIILDAVNGLETANNPDNGILGRELETDSEFRIRIKNSLNVNSIAVLSAIRANLEQIDGVVGTYLYDNYSTSSVGVDDITVPAHSILAIVDGGNEDEIAQVLYNKKTIGAGYIDATVIGADGNDYILSSITGNKSVWLRGNTAFYINNSRMPTVGDSIYSDAECTVQETTVSSKNIESGMEVVVRYVLDPIYGTTYKVEFIRPKIVDLVVNITVARQNYTGSDLESDVKSAIVNWANGKNDEVDGLKIGTDVSPFEISAAVSNTIPEIFIRDCKIAKTGSTPVASILTMDVAEKGEILVNNITVTVI